MRFKFLQDTGFLYAEFCVGWMMQMYRLEENALLGRRVEGRTCAPTMEHARKRTDNPGSSYKRMEA